MSEKSTNIFLKIAKISFWVIVGLILILTGLRFSLNTKSVQDFAKNKIVEIANESLTTGFSIQDLSGDLWKEIRLTGIYVGDEDTVAYVDSLYANYDILSLLSGTFDVNNIRLSGAKANVRQSGFDQDSSAVFNVQQIVKEDTTTENSEIAFNLNQIEILKSEVNVFSPQLLPDTTLSVRDIEMKANLAFGEEIEAGLQNLGFRIYEGRLPEPIAFRTSGNYQDEVITLNDLVLNTGRSVFNAKGTVNLEDTLTNSNVSFRPLSLKDVDAYLEQGLIEEDLTLTLSAKGGRENLQLELTANSQNIRNLEATAKLNFESETVLEQFGIRGDGLNIAAITNDSIDVRTGLFQATMDGILVQDLKKADITWGFTIEGIQYEEYIFSRFFGSGSLKNSKVLANLDITSGGTERLTVNPTIENIFDENTNWKVSARLINFNARFWAENAPNTDIKLSIRANGKGFELSETPLNITVVNTTTYPTDKEYLAFVKKYGLEPPKKMRIGDEEIKYFRVRTSITKDSLSAEGLTVLENSEINFNAEASDFLSEIPKFSYALSSQDLDVSELNALSDFPTGIKFEVSGQGSGKSLEQLDLSGTAKVDTSFVNGAQINFLDAEYNIKDGILKVPSATLKSEIADADFSGRKNVMDQKDPENILSFDMEIKNTQPFAEIADLEILQLQGNVSAEVKENEDGYLRCEAAFDLNSIVIDDLFLADGISGNGDVVMKEEEQGMFELKISNPRIYDTQLQDITFSTNSTRTADSLIGNYSVEIEDDQNGMIASSGDYEVELERLQVRLMMQKLDFITNDNSLRLQNTFNISYQDGAVQTDSLELVSPNGAFMSLAVPYADSLNQQVWLVGENFDFGILQEILLKERYVDGVLSGKLNINKTPDSLSGSGNIELQNVEYEGVQADIFNLQFNVKEKRLTSSLSLLWDREKVVSGNLNVPFDLTPPEDLSDEFFDETVSGSLSIAPTELSRFQSALEEFGITGTQGIISFDGNLSGTAGSPDFNGLLKISDPVVSEIPLDSVFADFKFSQTEETLIINSEVIAAKQKAADIEIDFPFSYDFKTFELNTVGEDRPVSAIIKTTNFNLAVFNDFLDKDYTKNLKGILNGNLDLKGTEERITANGSFKLDKSSFEIPIAGIKVDGINSEVRFTDDRVNLVSLNANSGKGSFSANGTVNLDGITPTNLDISAKANQFKAANTDEYNLVVDLNSKVTGPVTAPTATGRFAVKNGFIVLDDFGDNAVEDVQLEGEETENISYYDSLSIDMEFAIERNFFVRNRRYLDMEVEIEGELDAQKQKDGELSLFGTVEGTSGYLRPLGKRFEIDEAEVIFSGPPENPDLNVRSEYIPQSRKGGQEVSIFYLVKGTAEDSEFSFESDPPMEQQDIICYTLFNRPCYALESWQGALTSSGGSSPTDLLTGVLLDEVEALATRELGVDVVQIDNTRVGNETGTSIKTGWYLNERTFFAIVNEITSSDPKTLFILEYALNNNLDLILTEGEDSNRRGIDLRWQFDY